MFLQQNEQWLQDRLIEKSRKAEHWKNGFVFDETTLTRVTNILTRRCSVICGYKSVDGGIKK